MNPVENTEITPADQPKRPVITLPKLSKRALLFVALIVLIVIVPFLINSIKPSAASDSNIIDLSFSEKKYAEVFSAKIDPTAALELSSFSATEGWADSNKEKRVVFDPNTVFNNSTSMQIANDGSDKTTISLTKNMDLSGSQNIRFFIFVPTKEDKDAINFLNLGFNGKTNSVVYATPLSPLRVGWNVVTISKDAFSPVIPTEAFNWNEVTGITFEMQARSMATVYIDRLWAEKDSAYTQIMNSVTDENMSYKTIGSKAYLLHHGVSSGIALLKKITSAKDYTYTAKMIPLKKGSFGIGTRMNSVNNYGYYLTLGGVDTGTWKLFKIGKPTLKSDTKILDEGYINNFVFEKNTPYWLRIQVTGSQISAYFSLDGKSFNKLASVSDDEYEKGGVGFFTPGSTVIIDAVQFEQ